MADAQARIRITAQDDSAAAFKKASANLEALQASAASLAGSLGGALAVGGLTALITGAIDAADELLMHLRGPVEFAEDDGAAPGL